MARTAARLYLPSPWRGTPRQLLAAIAAAKLPAPTS